MNKNDIRKLFKQKRNSLDNLEVTNYSKIIAKRILNLECYKNSTTVGLYMPINNEVDLISVWQDALAKHKKCYFPKVIDENTMIFLPSNNLDDFQKNIWGILEPTTDLKNSISVDKLDLILVPLVAFDLFGNRIGMGKGFYDKFLAKIFADDELQEDLARRTELYSLVDEDFCFESNLKFASAVRFRKKPGNILMGVGYDFQKISKIKSKTWDIKLDIIVTEKGFYIQDN